MLISYILISQVLARYSHEDYQVKNLFVATRCLCSFCFQYGTPYHEVTLSTAPKCEPIGIPMCETIGYNYTSMELSPFHHKTQTESGLEAHQFYPLVQLECSPDLRPFLCSLYTPVCMANYQKFLPPCRFLCERARAGCEPLMEQHGFQVIHHNYLSPLK